MNTYKELVKIVVKRLFIVVLFFQLCRITFYLFNKNAFDDLTLLNLIGGLHFDLSAIGYINLIFIIGHLIPGNFKFNPGYQKGLKIAFYAVNLLFIATNFVDFEYFKFTGRRSTFGLITASGMENEIGGLALSFLSEFWYIPLFFIAISILFWKLLGTVQIQKNSQKTDFKSILKQTSILVLCLGVCFLMARGGFGKKPLKVVDAITYGSTNDAPVILNTPFCILKTIGKKETLESPNFYKKEELDAIFNPVVQTQPKLPQQKKNVVILILESFGDENVQKGYTPYLDSLITKSYYFKNGFANGRVSIDAVPSTLSSIPSLMNTSFITSSYSLNEIYGLPKIMKNNGYNTSFFHGAFNGSQNFDQYCKVAGFDNYYGKNQYQGPESFDGKWGVFDEDFLQYFSKKLTTFHQPFFTTLFTISSHNPYVIPEKYKGKFPKGHTKITESIGYADYALKQFFKTAQKQSWYKNTLFVITADHTSSEPLEEISKTNVGKFSIPILFFDPSNPSLKGVSLKNFQQTDIMPSVIDYLNIKTKMVTYGKSFQSDKNFAVYYLNNIYHYVNNDYYMAFDGKKAISLYNFSKDVLMKNNLLHKDKKTTHEMERFIKAYVQSFNERVINNKLAVKSI
jgi:phosphoglycerol transferase MdoB-like AlkP superfamily enzyme